MSALPYAMGLSADSRARDPGEASPTTFHVTCDTAHSAIHFPLHRHDGDEIMWARGGRFDVLVDGRRFAVSADHLVWVPARTQHEADLHEGGILVSLFVDPGSRPPGEQWARSRVLEATVLQTALMDHLTRDERSGAERRRCLELLYSLINDSSESTGMLRMPTDPRGRSVAERLLADPAVMWRLAEWARSVGISSRTLARIFAAECGMSFADWRRAARMNAAASLLGDGHAISEVSSRVGYASTSAFIEAFRQVYGTTPAVFRREHARTSPVA